MVRDTEPRRQRVPCQQYHRTTMCIPRTPLKPVYVRFQTHALATPEPHIIRIETMLPVRMFCFFFISAGVLLMGTMLALGFAWGLFGGGALLLFIGGVSYFTLVRDLTIQIDKEHRKIHLSQKSLIRTNTIERYVLSDIKGIQLLRVFLPQGTTGYQDGDIPVTSYEVNLVLAIPEMQRKWLYSDRNPTRALQVADQIATALDVPMLDHREDSSPG